MPNLTPDQRERLLRFRIWAIHRLGGDAEDLQSELWSLRNPPDPNRVVGPFERYLLNVAVCELTEPRPYILLKALTDQAATQTTK